MIGGPGLTTQLFFASLREQELRLFIPPNILSVLDALFGGSISGENLLRATITLVDMRDILGNIATRQLVLDLIPPQKRMELRDRLELPRDDPLNANALSNPRLQRLQEFFGLSDDSIRPFQPQSATPVTPAYALFDHQRDVIHRLTPLLEQDNRRAILHLPTGVGKTRTAMHIVADFLKINEPSIVVWLASGVELLEQAVNSFHQAWTHLGNRNLSVHTMWGDRPVNLDGLRDGFLAVGLAKAWSLLNRSDPSWAVSLAPRVRLVVFDEAHQSIAQTYRRIVEELTLDYRCALLGLTATPGRTWNDIDADGALADFYGHNKVGLQLPGDNPIEYLIQHGYLARPTFRTLLSEPGLNLTDSEIHTIAQSFDVPDHVVEQLSMSEQYVTATVKAVEDLVRDHHKRILLFAATVTHAKMLAAVLTARFIMSSAITSSTPERERNRIIAQFLQNNDDPFVLVNFGVLTTGFDAPKASAVVIARPTKSLVLYSQMVGRAIRGPKAGGTEACEIITVVDPLLPGFGDVAAAFHNWEDVWQ